MNSFKAYITFLFEGADLLQHPGEVLGSCRPDPSRSTVIAKLRDRYRHRPVCATKALQEESQVFTTTLRCV